MHCMRKAVTIRTESPAQFTDIPQANMIYDGVQEPRTLQEIDAIIQNRTNMVFFSSIFCERILGR